MAQSWLVRIYTSMVVLVLLVVSLAACGDEGAAADAALDGGSNVDASSDAATGDAGTLDDRATPDDAGGPDAGADGGPASCAHAGGECVALVPRGCNEGVIGSAEWYSCGGGLGVMCCLPITTPPVCRAVGTASEGWYRPDGDRICLAACARHVASCEAIGTRSEGWYSDTTGAGCDTIPVERLVEWTTCAP